MTPRSLIVRIPIRINLLRPPPTSPVLFFCLSRHKWHRDHFRRRPFAAHVDREQRARLGLCHREVGHPDRAVHGRRHRTAAHHVHRRAVQGHATAVPRPPRGSTARSRPPPCTRSAR